MIILSNKAICNEAATDLPLSSQPWSTLLIIWAIIVISEDPRKISKPLNTRALSVGIRYRHTKALLRSEIYFNKTKLSSGLLRNINYLEYKHFPPFQWGKITIFTNFIMKILLLKILLTNNWQICLYIFQVYNMMIWYA